MFQTQDIYTYKLKELNISKLFFMFRMSTLREGRTHKKTTFKGLKIDDFT